MRWNFITVWGTMMARIGRGWLWRPAATGQLEDGLFAVNDQGDVNLYVYVKAGKTIAFDAGYWNATELGAEFDKIGIDPGSISHLFLTHADMDHAGGLDPDSRTNWFNGAEVYLGRQETQMTEGRTKRKLVFNSPVQITRPLKLLDDGEVVSLDGIEIRAIATPGHTPGHMAYLIDGRILICGDALNLKQGRVRGFYKMWNMDNQQMKESIRKLAGLNGVEIMTTAHTGWTADFEGAMADWRQEA